MAQQGHHGGNDPMLPFGYNQDYMHPHSTSPEHPHANYNQPQSVLDPSDAAFMQSFFNNPDAASQGEDVYSIGALSVDQKPPENTNFSANWDFNAQAHAQGQAHGQPTTLPGQPHAQFHSQGQITPQPHHSQPPPPPQHHHPHMGGAYQQRQQQQHHPQQQMTNPASDEDILSGASSLFNLSATQQSQQQQEGPGAGFGNSSWGNLGVGPVLAAPENLQSPLTSSGRQSSGGSLYTPTSSHNPSYGQQQQMPHQLQLQAQLMSTQQQQQQQQRHHSQPQPQPQSQPQQAHHSHVPTRSHSHTRHPSLQLDTTSYHQMFHQPHTQGWYMAQQALLQHQNQQQQQQLQNPQQGQQSQQRPQTLIRFGTDSLVQGPHAYRSNVVMLPEQEKAGNLMNVPLADQAAATTSPLQGFRPALPMQIYANQSASQVPTRPSSAGAGPQTAAAFAGMTMMSPMSGVMPRPGSSWSTMNIHGHAQGQSGDDTYATSVSRKRRKSQMEHDEAVEWSPPMQQRGNIPKRGPKVPKAESIGEDEVYEVQAPPRTPKRRKSTVTGRPSFDSAAESVSPSGSGSAPAESSAHASGGKKKAREAKPRHNLTEEQKRANHIHSEQKRRNIIKQGYDDLNGLVPSLAGGKSGFSKSEILKEVVAYLESTLNGNRAMEQMIAGSDSQGGADV